MNGKIRKYLPLLGIVAVLVLWGLWYSRPVGVETLFPDFDPDRVESCKQKSIAEMKKVPQNLHS